MNTAPKKAVVTMERNRDIVHQPTLDTTDTITLRLLGDEFVDVVLSTGVGEFRGRIYPGESIILDRVTAERFQRESADWELIDNRRMANG